MIDINLIDVLFSNGGQNKGFFYLIPQSGQSLSIGVGDSSSIVTGGELAGAYLFSGVQATSLTDTPITDQDTESYIPYAESGRQTHGYSMLAKLKESIDGGFIYASHGKGSSSVTDLSKGSVMYNNGLEMIDKGSNVAADLGLDYKIPFVDFIQGESGFVNRVTDKAELRALQDDYISDVSAKTGQSELPMIIDQTGAYYSTENARARFEYANENSDAYMACPKYMLNRLYNNTVTDWIHLNPEGYVIQGEYHGLCAASVMNGVDFKPLQPLSYQVVGNTIEITTNPVNGLSLDAATLPQCPSEGFVYSPAAGGEMSPTVTIQGDKVILDIGQPPRVGDVIDYGYSLDDSATHPSGEKLPCGNVRDNQGIPSSISGFTLNNWLVQFDYSLQRSDGVDTNIWIYGDPITTTGGAAGELIAGTNSDTNAGFEVGQAYLVTLKHNGNGGFRYRVCDDFKIMTGTGSEKQESFIMDIGSVSNLRNRMQYESDPFIGDIYDINIELQ